MIRLGCYEIEALIDLPGANPAIEAQVGLGADAPAQFFAVFFRPS